MRYLAVPEMPHRTLWAALRDWGHATPEWHTVADSLPKPTKTLCGRSYTSEAHRTWDQTPFAARCPSCQWLAVAADGARGALSVPDHPRRPHAPQEWPRL